MDKHKLRYAILKEIDKHNTSLTEVEFGVAEEEFDSAVRFLDREGYLIGIYYADDRPWINKLGPELTEKGEKYLKENSALAKTYKGLKEIRD
ncbi:YjcQ family protein [Clostridium botulinum]|uniref:YjcQ family protein n=1 Tax=Clostridium botulinum TaxID=1491 RepID=UPI001C9B5F2B|nr:YjcQ family protein [Clostridium botulinum]MBY6900204.1 hypothetical protein [Clostridium botulinum]MBY6914317.1 hypothetical protein [Clostridium botulinum]